MDGALHSMPRGQDLSCQPAAGLVVYGNLDPMITTGVTADNDDKVCHQPADLRRMGAFDVKSDKTFRFQHAFLGPGVKSAKRYSMSAILSADDLNDFISPGVACIKPVETLPKQASEEINVRLQIFFFFFYR